MSFSPSQTAATGRAQKLAVNATKEAWPGGTNRSALNTSAFTSAIRNNPTDRTIGTSCRLTLERLPLAATTTKTTRAAPTRRKAASHKAAIARSPVAMMGQLNPKIRMVAAPTR